MFEGLIVEIRGGGGGGSTMISSTRGAGFGGGADVPVVAFSLQAVSATSANFLFPLPAISAQNKE